MSKTICVTGIDGAGKNTLLELIAGNLKSFVIADIWDIMNRSNETQIFNTKKDIDNYLCSLSPDSRALFLAHALKYSVDKALETSAGYILLNAYYYKYFATEISLGADSGLIEDLMKIFPEPDIIFNLEIEAETAALRKKKFSRYECGMVLNPDIESFIKAQTKAKAKWEMFDKTKMISLDATKTPKLLLSEALNIIKP